MSIRLASNCSHCNSFTAAHMCKKHKLKVSEEYVCDQFSLLAKLDDSAQCTNCLRHGKDDCAHPNVAAEGMLCASWAPKV